MSQIDWHAAFVGRTASYDNNNVLSAAMVILNTFGGAFLIAFLFPLLAITPTALYACFPSLVLKKTGDVSDGRREKMKRSSDNVEYQPICVSKNNRLEMEQDELDIGRGELTLFENDDLFIGSVFRVGCQLLILQGMRVSVYIQQ